ncbi:MAG: hypothetical protein D6729_00785 [Deltaproteobacteria bacterium]|nr:MAG: hypothetical protein D6729_00785 [Deltaproteobacteria bacterium]
MARVVCAGHCTVDHIGVVPKFPPADRKEELEAFSLQGGGPAATAAAALARLGVAVRFVGRVSDDHFGVFARDSLLEAGVDCTDLEVLTGHVSPMSFVAVERSTGRRTIYWTRGDLPPLREEDVDPKVLEGAELLLIDGHHVEAQLALALAARQRGLEVLLDAGSLRDGMEDLLKVSTLVVASERFGAELAGSVDRAIRAIREMGPRVCVVTLGEDGAAGQDDRHHEVVAAYEVDEVVDTTGAGDVYHGAFAYGVLQGWGLRRTMEFAGAAAALSCRALGGRAALPTREEIEALQSG